MKDYGIVYSVTQPKAIDFTNDKVYIAEGITQTIRECEGTSEECYQFNLVEYDKDEYILLLAQKNADIEALREELEAAKIILGVE